MDPVYFFQTIAGPSYSHRDQLNSGLQQPGELDFHRLLTTATSSSSSSRKLQDSALNGSEQLAAALPERSEEPRAAFEYTVRPGDTLSEIVAGHLRRSGISHSRGELYSLVRAVAIDNNLTNPDRIFPGQNLSTDLLPTPSNDCRLAVDRQTATSEVSTAAPFRQDAIPAVSGQLNELGLQPPAIGRITSDFGFRNHPVTGRGQKHEGIDIGLPNGTPIKAIAGGTVTFAGEKGGYGLTIDIDHGDGLSSRYAHLSELRVRRGEIIDPGRIIARTGQSGLASGAHLHLEIHQDNLPINPLDLISRAEIEGDNLTAENNVEYTVRHGDTIANIVTRELRRRGLEISRQEIYDTVRQLATANELSNPDRIFAGQRLNLSTLEARVTPTADEAA